MRNNKSAYLFERQYTETSKKDSIEEKKDYWKSLLGQNVYDNLMETEDMFPSYLREDLYIIIGGDEKKLFQFQNVYVNNEELEQEIFFCDFYVSILNNYIEKLIQEIKEFQECWDEKILLNFALNMAKQLQGVCLRTLISKMHEYKSKDLLTGDTPEGEYQDFCKKTGNNSFYVDIFEQYPVLYRIVKERTENIKNYYVEIIQNYKRDYDNIQKTFGLQGDMQKIINIQGDFSDVHNNGKQVVILHLEEGQRILYKPHTMDNEKMYQKLLEFIGQQTRTEHLMYSILSYQDHSWCSVVKRCTCENIDQLKNYYMRLGEQLFLAYLLGTKDLHYENIIAAGEYPVLIDLENLVNIQYNHIREKANDEVYYQVLQSVLFTGLLPYYLWNEMGEGINNSALGGRKNQQYPFKIAGVINPRTSDMQIRYYHPAVKEAQNSATLKGEYQSSYLYLDELVAGFTQAYKCVMQNQSEIHEILAEMGNMKSRYLLAETQRYSMLLSSSYHPSLLRDGADREIFLYSIWKGRKKKDVEFVKSEVRAMLNGDIPYFYYQLNSRNLYSGNGMVVEDYFQQIPLEILLDKLSSLNQNDLQKQCEYIRLSLAISPENKEACINRVYAKSENPHMFRKNNIYKGDNHRQILYEMTEHLINHAVWNEKNTEVSWYNMLLASVNSMTWNIKPMGYYLYDGLAGMLLILEGLKEVMDDERILRLRDTVQSMLFDYTKQGIHSLNNLLSLRTGAYDGESSILYTYLALYKKTNDIEYLEYAKQHARIIELLIEQDSQYDLISGNAGAIQALLKLYEIVPDERYLDMVRRATVILENAAKKMSKGIGWVCDNSLPAMAGMAHGNAGIILTLINVWKLLGEDKYLLLVSEALEYENALYNENINNWRDMRVGEIIDDDTDSVAWCHGVAGILLSRVQSYNCLKSVCCEELRGQDSELVADLMKELEKDIVRAYKKLKEYPYRDSFGLCHGTFGNMWILEEAVRNCDLLQKDNGDNTEVVLVSDDLNVELLPQERLNPGMMNGYGGIIYYLLKVQGCDVPNVLKLEV